jgi:signal transduction histidine kinase
VVTDGLLTREPAAVARVADVVERDLLDRNHVRVKIWTATGTIVYSDERRLEGATYDLDADERAAIRDGKVEAAVSDLGKPENRFERRWDKLLEVYLPLRTPSGERLLFEAYFRYGAVSSAGARIWRTFAPISLGSLVLLELVQIPIAWSLARRLRQRQREREALLRRALEASDTERRRIAADLHDGVVQDLAGVAYALAGAARGDGQQAATRQVLDAAASDVRSSITSLRSLLVDIYPPNLADEGLASAVSDLLARADGRGITASLDVAGLRGRVPVPAAALLYRVAQEALRNVFTHARARTLAVRIESDGSRVLLEVVDDGVGFDVAAVNSGAQAGHFGLKGMRDLVAGAGGTLRIDSAPGDGTRVQAGVPLR